MRPAAFLAEMERAVPWSALCARALLPKPGNVRPLIGVERMLRLYFQQHWFNLSDPAVEDAVYDSQAKRRFVEIDLAHEPAPDETTLCRFCLLLEARDLGRRLFDEVQHHLAANELQVATGTIVDAVPAKAGIINARPRPRTAPGRATPINQEGQPVALRPEGACWRRQPHQAHSRGGGDPGRPPGIARSICLAKRPGCGATRPIAVGAR
jgi:transposase, IS5 family